MTRPWRRRVLLAFLMLLAATPRAWAGAWTLPENRWYVEYFYRYFGSKHLFDSEGNSGRRAKTALFQDIRNELKLEYGLTDWWNLLASAPYISSHYRDDNIDLLRTGVGDIYLRTKFRLLNRPLLTADQPLVGSAQFSVKIPSAYDPRENPIGDGQVDWESRLLLSQAWAFDPSVVPAPSARPSAQEPSPASRPEAFTGQEPVSRDGALRDAMILASLESRARDLYEEGAYAEAAKWFQAVLETDPYHYEALRTVLGHGAQALAEASQEGARAQEAMILTTDADDPLIPPAASPGATETRYAKVAFVNLEGGFTARIEDPANEFPMVLEAGITPFKRLMLIGSLDAVVSVNSTNEEEENFAKWGLRGIVNVWGDGFASVFRTGGPTVNLEIGYNDIFAGRNTADAFEVFGKLGIFF